MQSAIDLLIARAIQILNAPRTHTDEYLKTEICAHFHPRAPSKGVKIYTFPIFCAQILNSVHNSPLFTSFSPRPQDQHTFHSTMFRASAFYLCTLAFATLNVSKFQLCTFRCQTMNLFTLSFSAFHTSRLRSRLWNWTLWTCRSGKWKAETLANLKSLWVPAERK